MRAPSGRDPCWGGEACDLVLTSVVRCGSTLPWVAAATLICAGTGLETMEAA